MPRYKLTIEYDGTPFVGWQRQSNGLSVQEALERAIERFTHEPVTLTAAGRTDRGVHAEGQVAHLDLTRDWSTERLRDAANALVRPHPIAVLKAEAAAPSFHARFDAILRAYRYLVIERRAPLALERHRALRFPAPLDLASMRRAAEALIGRHDFTTFRAAECQAKSPIKTLDILRIERNGDHIRFTFEARSFLHSQVRSMVGSLIEVGRGRWEPERMREALEARSRAACGPLAPPDGLTLMRVDYPPGPSAACASPVRTS